MNKIDMQTNPNNSIGGMVIDSNINNNIHTDTKWAISSSATTTAGIAWSSPSTTHTMITEDYATSSDIIALKKEVDDLKKMMGFMADIMDGYIEKEKELKQIREYLNT